MRAGRAAGLLAAIALHALAVQAKVPEWVRTAASTAHAPAAGAHAVVLLDDTLVTVSPDGTLNTRYRRVVKILTTAGRGEGVAAVWYDHDTKLRTLRGWSIDATGEEYEVRERDAIETTPADFELYTDARMKVLNLPAANPGSVVAYESEVTDKPYLPQTVWRIQEEIPVELARYELRLPAGWTHEASWIQHPPVAPQGTIWEVRGVSALPDEPRRPSSAALGARMGIQLLAPGAKPLTWSGIANWFGDLAASRSAATPPVQTKARELAGAGDPVRSIARFCQRDVRYVAVEIGIGGYQPHAAGEVFSNRFGDCKDKATLLRAMLREAGVTTYDVLIHTDRGVTDPAFPSMSAFNHVIAAIAVPPEAAQGHAAVVKHPRLGNLLLFDPTITTTPFGELPSWLQGTRGLLVTPDGGELIDLPAQTPAVSQLRRAGNLSVDEQGSLAGMLEERRTGHLASSMRSSLQSLTAAERTHTIESMVASHLPGATTSNVEIANLDDPEADLVIRYHVRAPLYAKRVADMLLVRPRVVGQKTETIVNLANRKHDYVTEGPSLHVDEIDIRVPATLKVDELPVPVELTTPAVSYASASTFDAGVLRYRRRYELKTFVVPRAALPELNQAWTKILGDERASAVFR